MNIEELTTNRTYRWPNQKEILVYLGHNESGNGYWHQFSLIQNTSRVWGECTSGDIKMMEIANITFTAISEEHHLHCTGNGSDTKELWVVNGAWKGKVKGNWFAPVLYPDNRLRVTDWVVKVDAHDHRVRIITSTSKQLTRS